MMGSEMAHGDRPEGLTAAASVAASVSGLVGQPIADVERELILQTLRHCRGNRSAAAVMLGISVRTMRNKLRSFLADGMAVPPSLGAPVRHALAAGA
jgi:DNA-binding NtrC family response regulator